MHGSRSRRTPRPFSRTALERPSQHFLELDRGRPRVSVRLPELHRAGVVLPHDEIHLRATALAKPLLDDVHQASRESSAALIRAHRDVIEPAAPAIPAAQRGRGESMFVERQQEKSGIAFAECGERTVVVAGTYLDARHLPERTHRGAIARAELAHVHFSTLCARLRPLRGVASPHRAALHDSLLADELLVARLSLILPCRARRSLSG